MLLPLAAALVGSLFSADPNEPVSGIAYRGGLRGTIGVTLPLVDRAGVDGFRLAVPALIELYNRDSVVAIVPFEYWRGRFAIEASWQRKRRIAGQDVRTELIFALEHESDHPTMLAWSPWGWVNLNDVAVRGRVATEARGLAVEAGALLRFHVLTCTLDPTFCGDAGGLGGSRTFELGAESSVSGRLSNAWAASWFASIAGGWSQGRELAVEELRVVANAGFIVPRATGDLVPYVVVLAGNELGFHRATKVLHAGLGLRWVPFER